MEPYISYILSIYQIMISTARLKPVLPDLEGYHSMPSFRHLWICFKISFQMANCYISLKTVENPGLPAEKQHKSSGS